MQGVQTLEALMDQLPQPTWPVWLLPRLCAAVARGLQPPLLGMSGQTAKSAVLYESSTRSSSNAAQKQVLHALCGVGELMCRLAEVLHAAWKGEAQQLRVADGEFVRLVAVKSGAPARAGQVFVGCALTGGAAAMQRKCRWCCTRCLGGADAAIGCLEGAAYGTDCGGCKLSRTRGEGGSRGTGVVTGDSEGCKLQKLQQLIVLVADAECDDGA